MYRSQSGNTDATSTPCGKIFLYWTEFCSETGQQKVPFKDCFPSWRFRSWFRNHQGSPTCVMRVFIQIYCIFTDLVSLVHDLPLSLACARSLSLSLSHTHTTHTHALSLTHTHANTHSLSLTHTHTHIHTHTHTYTHAHTHTHAHAHTHRDTSTDMTRIQT